MTKCDFCGYDQKGKCKAAESVRRLRCEQAIKRMCDALKAAQTKEHGVCSK